MNKFNYIPIVLLSCDRYKDIWPIFFYFLKKNWPEYCGKIYLINDSLQYTNNDFEIVCSSEIINNEISWSERVKKYIQTKITEENFILIIDDYFILSKVNDMYYKECQEIINDRSVGVFYLVGDSSYKNNKKYNQISEYRKYTFRYYLNLQIGIWNKNFLLDVLRDHETPWDFEKLSSIRGLKSSYKILQVISLSKNGRGNVINYNPQKYGLSNGKWMNETKLLFEIENINIDLKIRGNINKINSKIILNKSFIKKIFNFPLKLIKSL